MEKSKNSKLENYPKLFKYQNLEDINQIISIKNSENNIFYFKPENQDNYLLDFLIIIKNSVNNISIIGCQITKFKPIERKRVYINHLKNNVKKKFELLYNIIISEIYLWFILCNESIENNDTCKILEDEKIKYIFYSIKNRCFYIERNKEKINDLQYLKRFSYISYKRNK